MGSWGSYPWQADAPHDRLADIIKPLSRWVDECIDGDGPVKTDTERSLVRAACDVLLRLAPYMPSGDRVAKGAVASKKMRLALEALPSEPEAAAYDAALVHALDSLASGKMPLLVVSDVQAIRDVGW